MMIMRIACLIESYFEDSEYTVPAKSFTDEGFEVVHIGLKKGEMVTGKDKKAEVTIDQSVNEANPADYDALFIPGGYSPDRLRINDKAVKFVRSFMQNDRPVFAICHAPQLLITADVLRGRKVTGWKSIAQDVKNAGAQYVDREVVEDGNLITSRGPEDLKAFTEACINKLQMEAHPVA